MPAFAERLFVHAFSNPALSRPLGWLADRHVPGPLLRLFIRGYARLYAVDMSEVALPLAAFPTFNAFFTRRLCAGVRPVDPRPDALVAPCDSRLSQGGHVPEHGRLEQIKGRSFTAEALLGSADDAQAFHRGVYATLYLSPSMYHRVHSPVDGTIRAWRNIPGRLFPVNPPAVRQVEALFAVNERMVVLIDSERFGPVAVVLVGAANVGRISLAFSDLVTNQGRPRTELRPPAPIPIQRGDELGTFNLGSTVVMLAADPTLQLVGARPGELVKLGQPLFHRGFGGRSPP
jgi:phosphatidylserine decarboxylase